MHTTTQVVKQLTLLGAGVAPCRLAAVSGYLFAVRGSAAPRPSEQTKAVAPPRRECSGHPFRTLALRKPAHFMEYADTLETTSADAGYCPACLQHLDSGRCTCTEDEQADGYQGCICRGEYCTC